MPPAKPGKKPINKMVEKAIQERIPWSIDSGRKFGEKQKKYRALLREIEKKHGKKARKEFVKKRKAMYRQRKKILSKTKAWVKERMKRFPFFYGVFVHGSFAYGKAKPRDIDLVPVFHPKATQRDSMRVWEYERKPTTKSIERGPSIKAGEKHYSIGGRFWNLAGKPPHAFLLGKKMFKKLFDDFHARSIEMGGARTEEKGGRSYGWYVRRTPELFIGSEKLKGIVKEMYSILKNTNNWKNASIEFDKKIQPLIDSFNKEMKKKTDKKKQRQALANELRSARAEDRRWRYWRKQPRSRRRKSLLTGYKVMRTTLKELSDIMRFDFQGFVSKKRGRVKIIDLGCGPGTALRGLRKIFPDKKRVELTGVGLARHSQWRGKGINFVVSPFHKLSKKLRGQKFDLAYSEMGLFHSGDLKRDASAIREILADNALLLVDVPREVMSEEHDEYDLTKPSDWLEKFPGFSLEKAHSYTDSPWGHRGDLWILHLRKKPNAKNRKK